MVGNIFGRKKKYEKELQEQRDLYAQIQRQEEAQRREKHQVQEQLRQKNQQLEQERQVRANQAEAQRRERERLEREREQKEKQRRDREQARLEKMRVTTPEALRGLRDLIRTRYDMDTEIWSLKNARRPDRPVVQEKMEKADAVLMTILTTVETWEQNDNTWTAEEWKLASDIKQRVLMDGKRWWENNPPWQEDGRHAY